MFAVWWYRHRLPTSVRATGDNIGDGHAFVIWRDWHCLPAGVGFRTYMRYSASTLLRNHRVLETRRVVDMLQRQGYKIPIVGVTTPSKLQEPVQGGALAENVTKVSSTQGVNENLAQHVFGINTAQHDAGERAMALGRDRIRLQTSSKK